MVIIMRWPNMREDWLSRFLGIDTDAKYAAFCKDYISNIREEYLGSIESTRALLEREKAGVTTDKQQLATAAAAIAANGANNEERMAQITIKRE